MASTDRPTSFIYSLVKNESSSALSPVVKQLLCDIGVADDVSSRSVAAEVCTEPAAVRGRLRRQQDLLSADGFILFDQCADLLPRISGQPAEDYYINSVSALAETFRCSQDILQDMPLEEFSHIYEESLVALDCFIIISLFLLGGKQCPLMLKDLITARELEQSLGPHVLRLLQVVIGPPVSMNIRNVCWHGFLSEHELPRRYIFFLLLLTASLGRVLQDRGIYHGDICARDYHSLTRTDDIALPDAAARSLEECLLNSWLVTSENINFFKAALAFLKHQKYGLCSVLLLPLLEHSLRRLFVVVNDCPHRLVTAEATSLYTTFEEILDQSLPDRRENKLGQVLGEPCMDLLHDLLIYPGGPRVRDKLGHGEADCHTVPGSLPVILLVIFARLARIAHDDDDDFEVSSCTPVAEMLHGLSGYRSVFHPVSLLHQRIQNLCSVAATLPADLHTSPGLENWNLGDGVEVFFNKNEVFMDIQQSLTQWLESIAASMGAVTLSEWQQMRPRLSTPFSCVYEDVTRMLPHKLKTLYRWQKDVYTVKKLDDGVQQTLHLDIRRLVSSENVKVTESEIVGILSRMIAETETVLTQTRLALQLRQEQLQKKQLRSRQRDNLTRLLAFLPCASLLANYVAVLSAWQVSHLDDYQTLDTRGLKTLQRFLKSTLRTCENVRTFTSRESNKWSQASQVLVEELKSAVKLSGLSVFFGKAVEGKSFSHML
ncbi:unnamed protein product [Candidula unifasciata]|uniref:DUF4209 domain-containing protein n=1 Tax=Candidula unifasciata TaxID=100452 RepID=A0A8S3ZEE0_9EUPU|nr:unnamed protein product [Candidula unifasciata]